MAKAIHINPASGAGRSSSAPLGTATQPIPLEQFAPTPLWVWAIGFAVVFLGYFFWSTKSNGFYQQDEAGHFINMLDFWHDPKALLGNWAKFGYKLLYVVPAKLGGLTLVTAANCLLAAGAPLLVGLALQVQKSRYAQAGFVLAALQPLWISLSFRCYSEVPTAFLLALAYYLHVRNRHLLSMLCISYICTIRQEFYPILGIYGLVLLYQKRWIAAFAGALFPLVQNFYGAYFNGGDYLYLYNQITGQAGAIADAYPRQGGDHYLKTSMVIFGPIVVTLALHYLIWGALRRQKLDLYLAVPVVLYFTMQCLFNIKSPEIGPATGGNLRYMLVISPLMAAMGALALDQFGKSEKKIQALVYLIPLLLITVAYLNHKSDLIFLTEEKDGSPTIGVMLAGLLLFLPTKASTKTGILTGGMLMLMLFTVRPIKRSEEDRTCEQLARWYEQNEQVYKGRQLYVDHGMFFYFLHRTRHDFTPEPIYLDADNVEKAKKGDLVIWDSHFSIKRTKTKPVNQEYFLSHPEQWKMITEPLVTPSQNFGILIFERQ